MSEIYNYAWSKEQLSVDWICIKALEKGGIFLKAIKKPR